MGYVRNKSWWDFYQYILEWPAYWCPGNEFNRALNFCSFISFSKIIKQNLFIWKKCILKWLPKASPWRGSIKQCMINLFTYVTAVVAQRDKCPSFDPLYKRRYTPSIWPSPGWCILRPPPYIVQAHREGDSCIGTLQSIEENWTWWNVPPGTEVTKRIPQKRAKLDALLPHNQKYHISGWCVITATWCFPARPRKICVTK